MAKERENSTELLLAAVEKSEYGLAKAALNAGADVNVKAGWTKETCLHNTARNHDLAIAKLLIDSGAAVDERNEGDDTALHLAACFGNLAVAELLINTGADVNARNKSGETPLHVASANGMDGVVKMLIASGAAIRVENGEKITPLDIAVKRGDIETVNAMVDCLLRLGPMKPDKRTSKERAEAGHTAITRVSNDKPGLLKR